MKPVFAPTFAMMSSMIVMALFATPTHAAPYQVDGDITFTRVALQQPVDLLAARRAVVQSTAPRVACDPDQSQKICELRNAAARRAWEVVREEKSGANADANEATLQTAAMPGSVPTLLVPAGFIPVRAIACDPALSTEECAKLERRIPSTPPGPLPPTQPIPPVVPPVATPPDLGKIPAIAPVPVEPPGVIEPPPTGDGDLVKKPPKTGSQMPVIKPKAAPPVNPQP